MTKSISVKRLECDGNAPMRRGTRQTTPLPKRPVGSGTCTHTSAHGASGITSPPIPARIRVWNRTTVTVAAWMNFYR